MARWRRRGTRGGRCATAPRSSSGSVGLDPGIEGLWERDAEGELIVLDERLGRRQRRCVLAHELIHAERGIGHGAASLATMEHEEAQVRREVARRLVPAPALRGFLDRRLTVGPVTVADIADEFDVDHEVAREAAGLLAG